MRTLTAALATWIALALAPSCAPSGQPRGFESRQILRVRDPLLGLRAFSEDASQIYLARDLVDPATVKSTPPYNRSLLNLTTGEDQPVQEAVVNADFLAGGPGRGRTLVLLHYASPGDALVHLGGIAPSGPHPILSFVDETTGERLEIPDVAGFPMLGATRSDPMAVARFNAAGVVVTWLGSADNLMPVGMGTLLGLDATGAFAHLRELEHLLEPIVVHLPFDGAEATEVVPFHLGEYVAVPGDAGALPALGGASLGPGVGYACPTLPDGARGRCFLSFSRDLASDVRSFFVRFVDDPREFALPGAQQDSPLLVTSASPSLLSPRKQALTWLAVTLETGPRVFSWWVGADHAGSCASPEASIERTAWSANEDRFAVVGSTTSFTAASDTTITSSTLFTGAVGQACRAITSGSTAIRQLVFSPDGGMLARLEKDTDGNSTIHVSTFDGTGDRVIAAGADFEDIVFLDDRRLELLRSSADGVGISWLDPTATAAPEHPVAERVTRLASSAWLNTRWLLVGHSYSAQDDTFTLSAIDSQTGARRDVSTAVTDFRVPWTRPPPDATELPVVYIVRGRVASAQDGIWSARIPLGDFPLEP